MEVIEQSAEVIQMTHKPLQLIESAGRTCYKSEDKITKSSAVDFAKMIIKRGHESVLEHASATIRFITDRGVTHELVRHRLAAYSQESTRYCSYTGDIQFINPGFVPETEEYQEWECACEVAESSYHHLLESGVSPQIARAVLPNCLKTEIVMTANFREWRHVFKLRTSKAAHPQIRQLMNLAKSDLSTLVPEVFA